MKKWLFAGVVGLFVMPVFAQVALTHKFKDGEKITYETKLNMTQTITVEGNEIKTANEQTVVMGMNVGERGSDGALPVDCAITHLKTTLSLPGDITVKFDSKEAEEEEPDPRLEAIVNALRASAQLKYRLVYDKDNRVATVTGSESILETLDPVTAALLRDQIEAEYLKEATNQEIDQIPREPLKKGDKWQRTRNMRLGSGQSMQITSEYEYMGPVQHKGRMLHKIVAMAQNVTYEQDAAAAAPVKVLSSDLDIRTLEGAMFFDQEAGRVLEAHTKVKITGELKMSTQGQEHECKLDLTVSADAVTR